MLYTTITAMMERLQGNDHLYKDGPLGGTVDLSGFIQVEGDIFQRRKEHDHRGAELPDLHHADGAQRLTGVAQPLYTGQVQGGQDRVDDAGIHEHDLPQQGNRHAAAKKGRDVVQGADQVDALDVAVQ